MTTLADKIEALARSAAQTADDIRYYSGGSKHNQPAEDLADLIMRNLPTILRALRERDQTVEALKTTDAWLDRWARHIGDCPGIDDCTCGLTRVRYEAETTLASIEGAGHE